EDHSCACSHPADARYRITTTEDHRLLPILHIHHNLTLDWSTPVNEKARYIPAEGTSRQIKYPQIKIRSTKDHVCDTCMMKASGHENKYGQVSSNQLALVEVIGDRTHMARTMRSAYREDQELASTDENHVVLTIEYAQNVSLSHAAETPSPPDEVISLLASYLDYMNVLEVR
ncbi:TPA: LOW QUALITY PROTEIN: hypothetical protein N0F65_011686, partial [Lagenidium giganteum]